MALEQVNFYFYFGNYVMWLLLRWLSAYNPTEFMDVKMALLVGPYTGWETLKAEKLKY
jgi:hypothetical protein